MKLTANSLRLAPKPIKRGRPLAQPKVVFASRARFAKDCSTCEWLNDEYSCVKPLGSSGGLPRCRLELGVSKNPRSPSGGWLYRKLPGISRQDRAGRLASC